MTFPFKLVSADSHIVEPPDLWLERIERRHRDRAPRAVENSAALLAAQSMMFRPKSR